MYKKSVLLVSIFFMLISVSALNVTLTNINSTYAMINISNVTNLYAYEINLDYSISNNTVAFYSFLGTSGSQATYGSTERDGILSAYGSRLDSSGLGVNGSGPLFNVSHLGTLSLRYSLAIYANGTQEYTYYNNTQSQNTATGGNTGGGSSGGGGGSTSQLSLSPNILKLTLTEGHTTKEKVQISNRGSQTEIIEIDAGALSPYIAAFVPNTPFLIPQNSSTNLNIDFFAGRDIPPDVYTGEIKIKTPTTTLALPVILEIVEEEPLFDVITSLDGDEYSSDEIVTATIEVQNFGDLQNIDILLHYSIKDLQGNELIYEEGSYAINNYKLQLVAKLRVPRNTNVGDRLIFYAKATYPQKEISASASSVFTVVEPSFSPFGSASGALIILVVFALVIAVAVITVIIVFNFRKTSSKTNPSLQINQ